MVVLGVPVKTNVGVRAARDVVEIPRRAKTIVRKPSNERSRDEVPGRVLSMRGVLIVLCAREI